MALLYDIVLLQFLGLITVKICKFLKNKFLYIDKIFDFFLRAGHLIRELIHFIVSRILFVPKEWSDYNYNNKSGWGDIDYELTPEYIERTSFLEFIEPKGYLMIDIESNFIQVEFHTLTSLPMSIIELPVRNFDLDYDSLLSAIKPGLHRTLLRLTVEN